MSLNKLHWFSRVNRLQKYIGYRYGVQDKKKILKLMQYNMIVHNTDIKEVSPVSQSVMTAW